MKLIYTLALTLALSVGAFANMKTVAEKARAAQQHAQEIDAMLKAKSFDTAKIAEKANALHSQAVEMHEVLATADRSNAEVAKLHDAAQILKVLTQTKLDMAAKATDKDRGALRATAQNLATRAEQIAKAASKIGG
jgi:uncharacterized protein (DUF3084 family)